MNPTYPYLRKEVVIAEPRSRGAAERTVATEMAEHGGNKDFRRDGRY
jgi:hypothetical protein